MKIQITDKSTRSLLLPSISARIVCGILIDCPELYNSGWLAILLGSILALPVLACAERLWIEQIAAPPCSLRKKNALRCLLPLWFFAFALDSAYVAASVSGSASYMILDSSGMPRLMLPLFLLCIACLRFNGDAIGFSAGLWNRLLLVLLALVCAFQFGKYRPQWLSPILSTDFKALLRGALHTAGWLGLSAGFFIFSKPSDTPVHGQMTKNILISAAFAIGIALSFSLLAPPIFDKDLFQRSFRLDTLLANGRTPLALQLPEVILWFVGLFYTLLADAFAASALMQQIFPKLDGHACIASAVIAMGLLTMANLGSRNAMRTAADFLFPVQITLFLLGFAIVRFRKRRYRA